MNDPKYITIDGLSGSGKSTQGKAVGRSLGGWDYANFENDFTLIDQITELIELRRFKCSDFAKTIQNFALLRWLVDGQANNFVVTNYFWLHIRGIPSDKAFSEIRQLVHLFKDMLADKPPLASFFLDTDPNVRYQRVFTRDSDQSSYYKIEDIQINIEDNTDDQRAREYFEWLRSEIDIPIHIINNNQPVEQVTADILSKL